ncbi:uncharacterized protein zgc:136439 isoform X2 [Acipenser ruthenus]|uniref:uncharacterized protein zgc:136439 isoform X2 n=1 Tax=Acipenser ruthenus TaxID=7906 RepID=UPI002741C270|nr:uncharacterized protein zgc:136439 isoform X2 [Acipenser ruthenus]
MKAVILAAGYGTRLQRDLQNDPTGRFKSLIGIPKPLLPVGHSALISRWIAALENTACIDGIFVVTNDLYYQIFEQWAKQFTVVKIINDGTRCNEERLGAVACLQLAVDHFQIEDHLLVIGGDTLFKEDFSLSNFMDSFLQLQSKCEESNLVLSCLCKDKETTKYGILEVDEDLRVCAMKEKPSPDETTSRRANAPIEVKDAPGNFLSWLISRKPVYIHQISGRFDVGNLSSYIECDSYFHGKLKDVNNYLK